MGQECAGMHKGNDVIDARRDRETLDQDQAIAELEQAIRESQEAELGDSDEAAREAEPTD